MNLYELLEHPLVYSLKTHIVSLGRAPVCAYLRKHAALPPGSRVLDVGCGIGRHTGEFGVAVCGVDLNPSYVQRAAAQCHGAFLVMSSFSLAFESETFDFVFCAGLCHHLPDEEVIATVRDMKRVTRSGGKAVVIDGVLPSALNLPGYVLFSLDRGAHIRRLGRLAALLEPEGFELDTASLPGSFPYQRAAFAWKR